MSYRQGLRPAIYYVALTALAEALQARLPTRNVIEPDKIYLIFDATTSASSIRISDVSGHVIDRILVNTNETEYVLDVHTYPEGVYYYEINGKCQSFMIK